MMPGTMLPHLRQIHPACMETEPWEASRCKYNIVEIRLLLVFYKQEPGVEASPVSMLY